MGALFSNKNKDIENDNKTLEKQETKNEEKEKEEKKLFNLKIYICGEGKGKQYIIDNIFKDSIIDEYFKKKADKEFKTDQFHWIARLKFKHKLMEKVVNDIKEEIKKDRNEGDDEINKNILNRQAIICFGDNNVDILNKYYKYMRNPRIILVTEKKCEIKMEKNEDNKEEENEEEDEDDELDKRYFTNIIYNDNKSDEQISSEIISSLWELDCYFNERGNKICRYSPKNILKGLENENSLFTINILLLGLSRVGKSTFINLLLGKMQSLEADDSTSVTKKMNEYYVYRNDEKFEHGALKLIDTPGILPNNTEKEYQKELQEIINYIKKEEEEKNIQNKIHFIFFILNEEQMSLEGKNIDKVFKTLNESKCPVYFLINQVEVNEDEDKDEDDIELIKKQNAITDRLEFLKCNELAKKENIIFANFKKGEYGEINVSRIFKKISKYIKSKNILDKNLKSKIDVLLKNFRIKIEKENSFFSKKELEEQKDKINFKDEMNEIKELIKDNEFFNKINIKSIIDNGKELAKNCKKSIISLSGLKGIFPSISNNIPLISILQGFMVKEIEIGFGLNINSLNYALKSLQKNKENYFEQQKDKNNDKENKILDNDKLNDCFDDIQKIIQDKLNKTNESNKKLILTLSYFLYKLAEEAKRDYLEVDDKFDIKFTNIIKEFCVEYFQKEIEDSEGLIFYENYFKNLNLLLNDIDYYAEKKDWDSFKINVINI